MNHKEVEEYVLSLPNTRLAHPFGETVAVYQVYMGETDADGNIIDEDSGSWKMFALIAENKEPLRLSLKCDPQLAKILREKYETVLEGYHLNKKHWNTIILTGQIPWEDVQGFIVHGYNLVTGIHHSAPEA